LTVGQVASLTVTLTVTIEETIEVEAATAQSLDTAKAEVSQVIEERRITDLPIQGRQFIDFAKLTPSVTVGRSTSVGSQSPFSEPALKLSFGGVRETHSVFIALDGLDYTTSISGVQRASPSQDWVQEFRVVSNSYTADTGRHLGGIVNIVTKSGSNDVHGSIYYFFRNDALNAKNPLTSPGFETLRFNQFGFTASGPLVRNQTFLFGGYEGQRRAESPLYSDFILKNIDRINAVKQSLGLAAENLSILRINDYDQFIGKLTHHFSDATFLNARYLFTDQRNENVLGAPPGLGMPSTFRQNPIRDQTAAANVIHILSPALTSESAFQWGRRTLNLRPVGTGLEPALQIPNLVQMGGIVGGVIFYRETRLQFTENLAYQRGTHSFKFGGEFHTIWDRDLGPFFTPGLAVFTPESFFGDPPFFRPTAVLFIFGEPRALFGQPLPSRDPRFQAGLFASPAGEIFEDAASLRWRHEIYAVYGQDQWRLRPNVLLTLGLRYEIETKPSELADGRFFKNDFNNVQPRVGFSYSFDKQRGVLRGGFGIFHGQFGISDLIEGINSSGPIGPYLDNPLVAQFRDPEKSLIGFGTFGPVGPIPGPFTAGPAFANFLRTGAYPAPERLISFPAGFSQRDFPTPYALQTSLELEHQFGRDIFVSAGYSYVHAIKLQQPLNVNAKPFGVLPNGKTRFSAADPRFGFALLNTPTAFSIYHAGILTLRKSFSHHYSAMVNYVWSKSIDNITTLSLTTVAENFLRPDLERGLSDNHVGHRLTATFLAEGPKRGWLRDFKIAILAAAESARFFTIFTGFDTNSDNFPFPDRVGIAGRNVYKGDPFFNLDVRLQRQIPFTERVRGVFSVEVFNLFNVVNVLDINTVYGAADFIGPQPKAFGDGIRGPVPEFGSARFAAPARQLQFSFRLNF
ncbi:MAG: hypothetical protein D6723_05975, partial [Acidobacteria bacterium]